MAGTQAAESVQAAEPNDDEVVDEPETPEVDETANEEGDPPKTKPEDDEGEKAPETAKEEAPKGLTVTLDEEEDPPLPTGDRASEGWAKLQKQRRELQRRVRELETRPTPAPAQEAAPVLPPMPKSSDKDIGYDEDKLSQKMAEWVETKANVNAHQAKIKAAQQEEAQEKAASHGRYAAKRDALKETAPAYLDAERIVCSALSIGRQNDLMEADLDDPTKVVLALAQYPDELAEAVAIRSLPKFIKHLVALEKKVSVTPPTKKPKAPAEKTSTGSGSSAPGSTDKQLERLEAEARKTGNRAPVQRYKREQAEKQKKK